MYVIEVMNGPLDGKRWTFSRDITIGRDETDVDAAMLTDQSVSRRHATVAAADDGELVIADLRSRNGTIVDDLPITQPARLRVGQPFLVGRTLLRVLKAGAELEAEAT